MNLEQLSLEAHRKCFGPDDEIVRGLLKTIEGNIFVEFGAWIGGFASVIAKEAKARGGRLYSIDLFTDTHEGLDHADVHMKFPIKDIFVEHMKSEGVWDVISLNKGCSWEFAEIFEDRSVDFVWVDGSHHYEDVIRDIKAWWPKITKGGIIGGHDYLDPGVEKAVKEYFGNDYVIHYSPNMCWSKRKT